MQKSLSAINLPEPLSKPLLFSAQDMVSILKNHLALEMRKKETVKGPKTSAPYLAVIHRLDQPVEGILVFGKTKNAAASLTRQLTRNGF